MGGGRRRELLGEVLVAMLFSSNSAYSTQLKIFTVRAIASVLWEIGPDFERSTGNKLDVVLGYSPELSKRINAGEAFDLFVAPVARIDSLISDGKLTSNSRTLMVKSDAGVEVRAGARKPNIATVEAFKQALLDAKSMA
jgi:molybdate transport system substrate-binding protein